MNELNERERRTLGELFSEAQSALDAGRLDEAEAGFSQIVRAEPSMQPAWFNLGLVYKRLHRWEDCLRCNKRAAELDPEDEAAWWNLGTAATAVHDWETARAAWRGFGLGIPEGDGAITADYGHTPVRLNPHGDGEVVWCRRIDPVRAVVANIPLPESGHRWRDIVLHDGEPRGERTTGGQTYPVFDELERWQASEVPTLRVDLVEATDDDARALVDAFDQYGWAAEDWTRGIRRLCRACSEGTPSEHDHVAPEHGHPERVVGLAAPPEQAVKLLRLWAAESPTRRYAPPEVVG